ncbi:MAG: hypothetical protein ABIU95_01250 [Burkholderiales bacterium]
MTAKAVALSKALAQAIALLRAHDWQGAHAIVQQHEDNPIADHLHGIVHRIEGDLANSRYWYNKAGARFSATRSIEAELSEIETSLNPTV